MTKEEMENIVTAIIYGSFVGQYGADPIDSEDLAKKLINMAKANARYLISLDKLDNQLIQEYVADRNNVSEEMASIWESHINNAWGS